MADAAHGTPQEFWRPPAPLLEQEVATRPSSSMAEACPRCATEFLLGSRFCHTCGGRRPAAISPNTRADAAAVAHIWERSIHQMQAGLVSAYAGGKAILANWSKALGRLKAPQWLHYLHFHEIKNWIGLSTGSLVAFVIGLACVAGSLLVGLLTAKTLVDWQAIQIYRVEWLLAATASFVAGILLRRRDGSDRD